MTKAEFYELIKNHYNVIKDEKKFRALLCDYFPQEKQWRINALLFLYSHGIMEEIEKNPEMKLTEQARLKDELVDQYGMQARNAKWAVELWVKSYGKWVVEENELLNIIHNMAESTSSTLDIKKLEKVFRQAAKYPKVLRSLYKIYIPVIEQLGEKAIEPMVELFYGPLIGSVCTYEDYFELYKHLLELRWPGDYYVYGTLVFIGKSEYNIKQNSEKGLRWIAYFYDEVNKTKMQIYTAMEGVASYSLACIEYILGMAYAEGKYIKKDEQKAEECWSNMLTEPIDKWTSIDDAGLCCYCIGEAYKGEKVTRIVNKTIKFEFEINTNDELAYKYLVKAVEYGNANAMTTLAEMYEKGEYVDKDVKEARKLCIEADSKGNEDAREWLEKHAEVIECMNNE